MRTARQVLLACLFAAPLLAQKPTVRVKWEKAQDFSKYETYSWLESPTDDVADVTDRIIVDTLDAHMSIHGIFKDDFEPDLHVVYYGSAEESFEIGGGYRSSWSDPQAVTIQNHTAGTLVLDVVDADSGQVVWRGIATATIEPDPKKNVKTVREALRKMLDSFPPAPRRRR